MATKTKGGGKKFAWPSAPAKKVHTRSWADEQARIKKSKLAKPITPGSAVTEGQLATAADAAVKTQFGDLDRQEQIALAQAQSQQRDFGGTGGFYDQYLSQLAQHAAQVNSVSAQANAAAGGLQQGITGLGAADLTQLQGQANQMATQRGMPGTPAGDLTGMANQATAVRQGLAGALGAQTAQQGAAMQNYAGNLANVVGPGQKLQGQATLARGATKAQGDITATAAKKGAYQQQYKEETRASEAKNVLASQIAGGKQTIAEAAQTETTRSHKAGESIDRDRINSEIAKANQKAQEAGSKTILTGPFTGKTQDWLSTASDKDKQGLIDGYDSKHAAKGKGKGAGTDWLTKGQSGSGLTQAGILKGLAKAAKAGEPFRDLSPDDRKKWKKAPQSRAAAEAKITKFAGSKLKSPALLRAAVDAVYDGHLSAYTVKQLIAAGYKPSDVASTLGTKTHGQWLTTPAGRAWARGKKNPKLYGPAN